MRGDEERFEEMFSYVRLEERITADHPLRAIRSLVEDVLKKMSRKLGSLYWHTGRNFSSQQREQMIFRPQTV